MTQSKMVSIIISNYNGKEHLRECLSSLMKLKYPRYEVIVIDAGSTDGSPEMVKKDFPSVTLMEKRKIGIGEAINYGISLAEGDFIVFDLNNDDVVDENWLDSLVKVLDSSKDIGIVCGKRFCYGSNEILDSAGGKIDFLTGDTPVIGQNRKNSKEYDVQKEVDYVPVIMTKRDAINDIGLCDPEYYIYFEDTDFCIRATKAGYKVIYVPSAIFWHKGSTTVGKFSYKNYYYIRRNQIRFILKTFKLQFMIPAFVYCLLFKTTFDSLIMIAPIRKLIDLGFPRFKGYTRGRSDSKLAKAQWDALIWNLKNLKKTFQARWRVSKQLIARTSA